MSHYHFPIVCLIICLVVGAAHAQHAGTNDWHPNTKLLDLLARQRDPLMGDTGSAFAHDVKRFYELLREKKWHETYELRAKAFREIAPESDYLVKAKEGEKRWGLANYEVLSIEFETSYGSTNVNQAILICKFTELPDYVNSYSTVWWHKEEGVWKCLSAGPKNLEIFDGIILPTVDWR